MVSIYIENTKCRISGLNDQKVIGEFSRQMSYTVQNFQFMMGKSGWDGRYRLFNKKYGTYPVGLLALSERILKAERISYDVIDNRTKLKYGNPISSSNNFEDRDYQVNAIKTCMKKGSGIVRMSTGSGKSYVIASVTAKMNVRTIIYVVSIDLMYQMQKTLKDSYNIDAGVVGDGLCDIKDITIMTIWSAASAFNKKITSLDSEIKKDKIRKNNAEKVQSCVKSANMIVLDECQYAGSNTFQFLSRVSESAVHRFLFSGTPWREAGDDLLLEAAAGEKIVDIGASELIEKGFLVKPYITFKTIPAIRGIGKTYPEVYKNFIIENDYRNFCITENTKKLVDSGRTVLIIYSKINHGKNIKKMLDDMDVKSFILSGKNNSTERESIIQEVKDGKINVLLASSIFDQGVDIPVLDALIMAGGGKSTARVLQRVGRVLRPYASKKNAVILDFYDNCKFLRGHSEVRYKTCLTEKEYRLTKID